MVRLETEERNEFFPTQGKGEHEIATSLLESLMSGDSSAASSVVGEALTTVDGLHELALLERSLAEVEPGSELYSARTAFDDIRAGFGEEQDALYQKAVNFDLTQRSLDS